MDSQEHERLSVRSSEGIAASVLLALAFITPILFIPGSVLPFEAVKRFFVGIAIAVALIFWLVSRLSKSHVSIPKSYVFLGLGGLTIVGVLSALFVESTQSIFCKAGAVACTPGLWSAIRAHSLIGLGYELGTPLWLALLTVLLFLAGALMSDRKRVFLMYLSIFASSAIVTLYTLFRILPARWLVRYEWYQSLPISLVGKWNELGIFFGLTVLGIIVMLDLLRDFKTPLLPRAGIYALFGFSMLGLIFVNFYPVWVVLALSSVIIYVYALTADRASSEHPHENRVFRPSLLVAVIAVLFVLGGGQNGFIGEIVTRINNYMGVPQVLSLEPRPGFSDTLTVTERVLGKKPILGVGPNNFDSAWAQFKPASFNSSLAWDTDFDYGMGYLPSFAVTTGVFGLIFALIFVAAILIEGWRTMSNVLRDRMTNPLAAISFFVTLYLWIFAVIYTPNITLLILAVLSLGTMIALSVRSGALAELSIEYGNSARATFISTLVIIVLIIVSVGGGYLLLGRSWATTLFFRGLDRANTNGDLDSAEAYIIRAAGLGVRDQYARALTNLNILRMNKIVSQTDVPAETLQAQFLQQVDNATQNALTAYQIRPLFYQNAVSLANVYEVLSVYKVNGAKDEATKRYAEAAVLNPESPLIPYLSARMEASLGETTKAQKNLETAITKKADYPEAILFYSQIEASKGNIQNAAIIAERALTYAPNDLGVLFQAGYLKFQSESYNEARIILERAKALSPNYSNAKYFLGLTYSKLGESAKAIQEFTEISQLNPDNEEVKKILANLKAGLPALSGLQGGKTTTTKDE